MPLQHFLQQKNCLICNSPLITYLSSLRSKIILTETTAEFTVPINSLTHKVDYYVTYILSLYSNSVSFNFSKHGSILTDIPLSFLKSFKEYNDKTTYRLFSQCKKGCFTTSLVPFGIHLDDPKYSSAPYQNIYTFDNYYINNDFVNNTCTFFTKKGFSYNSREFQTLIIPKDKQDLIDKVNKILIFM